jgi:hypothetical protein
MQNVGDGELESPYASHDNNVATESYHANLKATLKVSKWRLFERQVDWCPPVNWRYFVTLLVLEFEKELGVCPKQKAGTICC